MKKSKPGKRAKHDSRKKQSKKKRQTIGRAIRKPVKEKPRKWVGKPLGKIPVERAYIDAIDTITECCYPKGLYASGGRSGYKGVWSRDSMISFLGASLIENRQFKDTFSQSLRLLKKYQSRHGQIPNAIHGFGGTRPRIDYGSIDSTLWYIIGNYTYRNRYKDPRFFESNWKSIERAMKWLSFQDMGETRLLEQLPTTDWQDAFPQKYGHTINTQVLYFKVLNLMGEHEKANDIKKKVNSVRELKLWNGEFYNAYRWKNHNRYKEIGDWFDSLGNLMAIVFGMTSSSMAEKIMLHIKRKKVHRPYPMKAIYPPIRASSEYWEDYYKDCDAGQPYHYLNGGIWTYIGCFYVLALMKMKRFQQAKAELRLLAKANLMGNPFPEWINPITSKTHGMLQAWSAGMYILAYESVKTGKVLV